jgi:hypothetical protein
MKKQMAEITRKSVRKEWRRPELRKLPIAATASQTQKEVGNEGGGEGKGDSGKTRIS